MCLCSAVCERENLNMVCGDVGRWGRVDDDGHVDASGGDVIGGDVSGDVDRVVGNDGDAGRVDVSGGDVSGDVSGGDVGCVHSVLGRMCCVTSSSCCVGWAISS